MREETKSALAILGGAAVILGAGYFLARREPSPAPSPTPLVPSPTPLQAPPGQAVTLCGKIHFSARIAPHYELWGGECIQVGQYTVPGGAAASCILQGMSDREFDYWSHVPCVKVTGTVTSQPGIWDMPVLQVSKIELCPGWVVTTLAATRR